MWRGTPGIDRGFGYLLPVFRLFFIRILSLCPLFSCPSPPCVRMHANNGTAAIFLASLFFFSSSPSDCCWRILHTRYSIRVLFYSVVFFSFFLSACCFRVALSALQSPRSLLSVQKTIIHDKHCFELYGYDVLVDADLKPWLIEVRWDGAVAKLITFRLGFIGMYTRLWSSCVGSLAPRVTWSRQTWAGNLEPVACRGTAGNKPCPCLAVRQLHSSLGLIGMKVDRCRRHPVADRGTAGRGGKRVVLGIASLQLFTALYGVGTNVFM